MLRKRTGHSHTLRLSTGKRTGALPGQMQQADFVEVSTGRFDFLAWYAPQSGRQRPVAPERAAANISQHTAPPAEIGVLGNQRERQTRPAQR